MLCYRKYRLKKHGGDSGRNDKHGKDRKDKHGKDRKESKSEVSSRRRKKRKWSHDRHSSNNDEDKPANSGEKNKKKEIPRDCMSRSYYVEKREENKITGRMCDLCEETEQFSSWRKSDFRDEVCCVEKGSSSSHSEKSLSTNKSDPPVSIVSNSVGNPSESGLDDTQSASTKCVLREQNQGSASPLNGTAYQRGYECQRFREFAGLGFSVHAFNKADYREGLVGDDNTGTGIQENLVDLHCTNEILQNSAENLNEPIVSPSNWRMNYNENEESCSESKSSSKQSKYSLSKKKSDERVSSTSHGTGDRESFESELHDSRHSISKNRVVDGDCNHNITSLMSNATSNSELSSRDTEQVARYGSSIQECNAASTTTLQDGCSDANSGSETQAVTQLHCTNETMQNLAEHAEIHAKESRINSLESFVSICNYSKHVFSGSLIGLATKECQSGVNTTQPSSCGSGNNSESVAVNRVRRSAKKTALGPKRVVDLIKVFFKARSKNSGIGIDSKQGGK